MSHFVLQRLIWGPARSCLGWSQQQIQWATKNHLPKLVFLSLQSSRTRPATIPATCWKMSTIGLRCRRAWEDGPSLALAPVSARVYGVRALETLPYDEVRHGWMLNCSCAASVVVPSSFCSTLATVAWRWALGSLPPAVMRAEGVRSFLVTLNIGQVGSTPSAVHANVALSTTRTRSSQRPGVYDPCTSQLSRHV